MIPFGQNDGNNLLKLAAQRELYNRARVLQSVRMVVSIGVPFLFALLVPLLRSQGIHRVLGWEPARWLPACIGVLAFLVDQLILRTRQSGEKNLAALIQERFDCDVLIMAWNDVSCPNKPPEEDTVTYGEPYLATHGADEFANWYPQLQQSCVPDWIFRLLCQRTNVWWDSSLRRRYISLLNTVGALIGIVVLVVALIQDTTVRDLLITVGGPVLPILGFWVKEISDNAAETRVLGEMQKTILDTWDDILRGVVGAAEVSNKSRQLQDLIYQHRLRSPLVPSWLYKRLKVSQEQTMVKTTDQLVEEFLNGVAAYNAGPRQVPGL